MYGNKASKRLRILYSIIKLTSPIELIDLSNLIFVLEKEGILRLGYSDWVHVSGLGVVSPLLEIDIARLAYKGLIAINNGMITTIASNHRDREDDMVGEIGQVIAKLGNNKEFLRTLALKYSRVSIVALKSNTSSNS